MMQTTRLNYGFTLAPEIANDRQLRCFNSAYGKLEVNILGPRAEIRLPGPLAHQAVPGSIAPCPAVMGAGAGLGASF